MNHLLDTVLQIGKICNTEPKRRFIPLCVKTKVDMAYRRKGGKIREARINFGAVIFKCGERLHIVSMGGTRSRDKFKDGNTVNIG